MKKAMSFVMMACVMGAAVPGFAETDVEILARYRAAAEKGDARAQFKLGERYEAGKGVPKDFKRALSWYRKATKQGYGWDVFEKGKTSLTSVTIARSLDNDADRVTYAKWAYLWLSVAVVQGKASAKRYRDKAARELKAGQIKEMGELARNWPKVKLKKKASVPAAAEKGMTLETLTARAQKGDAGAQFELGDRHERGRGVAKDKEQAVSWYRKAADQGLAKAQMRMGLVTDDKEESLAWYRKAAGQGYDIGPSKIGLMDKIDAQLAVLFGRPEAGSITAKYETVYFWFCVAVAQGDEDMVSHLEDAAKKLNAERIAAAKKKCDSWPKVMKK